MRGREVPRGESAAALRLRAHQQKMAMRANVRRRPEGRGPRLVPRRRIGSAWDPRRSSPMRREMDFRTITWSRDEPRPL